MASQPPPGISTRLSDWIALGHSALPRTTLNIPPPPPKPPVSKGK
jgi:hypothetical protein